MVTRRQFVTYSAAGLLVPRLSFAATKDSEAYTMLRAEPVEVGLLPDSNLKQNLWGFNGSTPGPELRVKQGEHVQVNFQNRVDKASSVHWHGIRIDNKMDGVTGLTQEAVAKGKDFDYRFVAPDAGTFWYHSHHQSLEQVARGLYGALIVEEKTPPDVDHDIVVFLDDWRLKRDGSFSGNFGNRHDMVHGGRVGNVVRALFHGETKNLKQGERVRLRLINTATDRVFPIGIKGISGKVVAYDGMPLKRPKTIRQVQVLAPAQRTDIIADITGEGIHFNFVVRDGEHPIGSLEVKGKTKKRGAILALPENKVAKPDLKNARKLTLSLEGGAMSRRSNSGEIWGLSGLSGFSGKPFHQSTALGETVIIKMENNSSFPHGMHIHGHHFQTLKGGKLGPLRDTILVDVRESIDVACVLDNPGKWAIHCHMLAHQAAGMKTWMQVG